MSNATELFPVRSTSVLKCSLFRPKITVQAGITSAKGLGGFADTVELNTTDGNQWSSSGQYHILASSPSSPEKVQKYWKVNRKTVQTVRVNSLDLFWPLSMSCVLPCFHLVPFYNYLGSLGLLRSMPPFGYRIWYQIWKPQPITRLQLSNESLSCPRSKETKMASGQLHKWTWVHWRISCSSYAQKSVRCASQRKRFSKPTVLAKLLIAWARAGWGLWGSVKSKDLNQLLKAMVSGSGEHLNNHAGVWSLKLHTFGTCVAIGDFNTLSRWDSSLYVPIQTNWGSYSRTEKGYLQFHPQVQLGDTKTWMWSAVCEQQGTSPHVYIICLENSSSLRALAGQ